MYRCNVCNAKRSSGMPQLRHAIYKPDGNIAAELPVCQSCKTELDAGVPLAGLRKRYAVVEESPTTPAIVPVCLEIPKTAAEVAAEMRRRMAALTSVVFGIQCGPQRPTVKRK